MVGRLPRHRLLSGSAKRPRDLVVLEAAKHAMGREVFKQELADRQALMDELMERVPEATLKAIRAKMPARKQADHHQAAS